MVRGLEHFKAHFAPYKNQYVLIGGTACTLLMQEVGLDFRATKDIDIVLYIEVLTKDFGKAFQRFIDEGGYQNIQQSSGKKIFYRFTSPKNSAYPHMLELFSRMHESMKFEVQGNVIPLALDNSILSLSAILLDEDCYSFAHAGKREVDDMSILSADHLIPLKARAYVNLKERKANGESIDETDIRKHRNDIIRLVRLLSPTTRISLPATIKNDLSAYLGDLVDDSSFDCKSLRVKNATTQEIASMLREIYGIT